MLYAYHPIHQWTKGSPKCTPPPAHAQKLAQGWTLSNYLLFNVPLLFWVNLTSILLAIPGLLFLAIAYGNPNATVTGYVLIIAAVIAGYGRVWYNTRNQ